MSVRVTLRFMLVVSMLFIIGVMPSQAEETGKSKGVGVPISVGAGFEVTHGDYGVNADATIVTVPVLVDLYPTNSTDLELYLPLVYLSSRSGSGVIVTQSGGMGRGRSTGSSTTTTTTSSTVSEAGLGDISLTGGWTALQDGSVSPKIRPTVYLKLPSGDKDRGLGTGTFEGGPGLSVSKWLGDFQLFAEGAYILQDSNATYAGKNYVSYSAGGGLQATDRLFASLYVKGSSARVDGGTAPVEGRVKLNFLLSRRISWEAYALAGFTNASPDVGGGVLMMYQF